MNILQAKNTEKLLEQLCAFIRQRLSTDQADKLIIFARHYFKFVAHEDIADRALEDLFGSVLSHWNLALDFPRNTAKVRVYNPTLEEHGWQSQHTVIEIVVEDMPFLVQSITMEINCFGFTNHLVIHPVFFVVRNSEKEILRISGSPQRNSEKECLIHVEINRQSNARVMLELQHSLMRVLADVRVATEDWHGCLQVLTENIQCLREKSAFQSESEVRDSVAFLQWLHDDHFVFLGYREYGIVRQRGQVGFRVIPGSGKGILRESVAVPPENDFIEMSGDVFNKYNEGKLLMITKATSRSTVHRPVFMDYIGIKQYDHQGRIIGEKRFLGLYSSAAYACDVRKIPMLNSKINRVMERSGFQLHTHDARELLFVLQSLPRDELFQADENSLFHCAMGVMRLRERQRVRVFVRHDIYGHFVSVLVFAPRERYHTDSRKKIQAILLQTFHGQKVDFSVQLSESILARIHFIIHSMDGCCIEYDVHEIEQKIIAALLEWKDDLQRELHSYYGEARGNALLSAYKDGFSAAYREDFSARTALLDLKSFEQLEGCPASPRGLLYSPLSASGKKALRFKIFCCGKQASLSRTLPMLENMGVKVCDERPYEISKSGFSHSFWMHDFGLIYQHAAGLNLEKLKPRFQQAFERCWDGHIENDGFNRLILEAGLTWRQVNILRALYFYFRQIGITFSQVYVETSLAENPHIAVLLVNLFYARFDPARERNELQYQQLVAQIEQAIDQVSSLDEDRILRRYFNLIQAIIRTNFFKKPCDEQGIPYFSIKLDSSAVDDMPSPVPCYEVYVYSPRMEGIHLRGGLVARGGVRWSDRLEDFRTEVLGLMKAQMTKNAVIVPTGAKGGFVVKRLHQMRDKEKLQREVIACYRILIRGLLDITDNLQGENVSKPDKVLCYDGDDPYLVVAADKGTAAFSDYANELSLQYGFWLGDAFASGGSAGYDHKAMGITAKGGWESVKYHFELLGIPMQATSFTVIGIGGMAGDVFGNGMLQSDKIKLLAAFDHCSIFLDPDADPEIAFQERKRLFSLPKASWNDYNQNLLSRGGGIYPRNAKSIKLTDEVKQLLDVDYEFLTPSHLIRVILCAPVDLLWNGGIGTYVKASDESDAAVGDRANDSVRVVATQLRCKAVVEGGNLGFTQAGRIEYAQMGGKINTDAIDNSAGVDCSDHEVNIKILLNTLVQQGDLTGKQRDRLLIEMTDQIAELVLKHNYQQNRAITMAEVESASEPGMVQRLIGILEAQGGLNRELECIPTNEILQERSTAGKGLTRPEISVLLAYCKQLLKANLLNEEHFPGETLLKNELLMYFPCQLREQFPEAVQQHRLGREIVVNRLVNSLINRLGMVYPFRLMDEMGYSAGEIVNAYKTVHQVMDIQALWDALETDDNLYAADLLEQNELIIRKTIERSMYWFLRRSTQETLSPGTTAKYAQGVGELTSVISGLLPEKEQDRMNKEVDGLINQGLPADLAVKIVQLDVLFLCLDVIDIQQRTGCLLQDAGKVFFSIITRLELSWVREQIIALPGDNVWESLARRSMREELNTICCLLAIDILCLKAVSVDAGIEQWLQSKQAVVTKYQQLMKLIAGEKKTDLSRITVILKELRNIHGEI